MELSVGEGGGGGRLLLGEGLDGAVEDHARDARLGAEVEHLKHHLRSRPRAAQHAGSLP